MHEEITFFASPHGNEPMAIEMTGISYCDGSYNIERKNSWVYVFEYILKGTGTVICDGRQFTASEGDVYVLPVGSNHRYFSDAQNPWTKIFFNIYGRLVDELMLVYGLQGRILFSHCPIKPLFDDFYEAAKLAKNKGNAENCSGVCSLKLHEIILALKQNVAQALAGQEFVNRSSEAEKIKRFLDLRVNGSVTIEEVSNAIFRSPDYTIKLFKKEYGVTPYCYLLSRKIETAKCLLRGTNLSIKEISTGLAFCDQHYFSNVFKRATGYSPKHYRISGE